MFDVITKLEEAAESLEEAIKLARDKVGCEDICNDDDQIELDPKDLRIDTYSVGNAVRITHLPTNLCEEGDGTIRFKVKREVLKKLTERVAKFKKGEVE